MGKHIDELEKHFIESIEKDGIQHSIQWFDKCYEALVRAEVRDEIAGLPDVWEVRRAHIGRFGIHFQRLQHAHSRSRESLGGRSRTPPARGYAQVEQGGGGGLRCFGSGSSGNRQYG